MDKKSKIIAFYLPQFHEIPENNKWWGEGFTEWTNTKKAKPLFKDHFQPRIPFNENYYDLSTTAPMVEQSKLAMNYGISGFCYYHYWFKGKKLLNKPLENMLLDKNVKIDFCLSWANEPWTRAWDGGDKEILMKQDYGNKEDWDKHLTYLIPFFEDSRYMKIENRPIFVIYRTESFADFDKMIDYWNAKLSLIGIKNLYIIETLNSFQIVPTCKLSSAVLEFEPMYTIANDYNFLERIFRVLKRKYNNDGLFKIDYSDVWKRILKRDTSLNYHDKKLFSGAFVDWDSTPRKGKNGLVMTKSSPLLFKKYFRSLVNSKNSEFIFINAWNEWAEGTYLEPDSKNEYQYLKAVKEVLDSKK